MRKRLFTIIGLLACALTAAGGGNVSHEDTKTHTAWGDEYNVVWNSPSHDASESMPFGGGDIGGNVWVERGSLYFYLQRSGCFDGSGEYLKLGRWRVRLTPNPFVDYSRFRQQLRLRDGYVEVEAASDSIIAKMQLWVDMESRAVHLDVKADRKINIEVAYESWRTEDHLLENSNHGRFGTFGMEGYADEVCKVADSICFADGGIRFFHRNEAHALSPWLMVDQQGVKSYSGVITDHNSQLTFGGLTCGEGFEPSGQGEGEYCGTGFRSWSLCSRRPSRHHHIAIITHKAQTATADEWLQQLDSRVAHLGTATASLRRTTEWWHRFWQRSYIVTDPLRRDSDERVWQMGRNYQLMRYQLGCNLMGDYPSKFNGGNFTFDPSLVDPQMRHDPDWRQWGGDVFTAQNQRLLYWPMLKAGDFDGMVSQFNLYEWGLPGAMAKVRTAFGHEGALFCEYAHSSGMDIGSGWGWSVGTSRQRGTEIPFGDPLADATHGYGTVVERGVMANPFISYHWESQVEYAYMMLEFNRFSGWNIDRYMPFIKQALIFFDRHYQIRQRLRSGSPLDEYGKLVFFPSTSCESYRGAKNPADLVAGIRACLQALLTLSSDSIGDADRSYFSAYLDRLPALPYAATAEGDSVVLPAESYKRYINEECPQFYPLFPFNCIDLTDSAMRFFHNTWRRGGFVKGKVQSWHQDGIFMARMGMTDEAFSYNMRKLQDAPRRFPTFWGPGHDWVPDHNWGGSGMIGLQEMLMQTVGDRIILLPAWPRDKDVCFRLHAPHSTVVELEYLGGQIRSLRVWPESRRKDITLMGER